MTQTTHVRIMMGALLAALIAIAFLAPRAAHASQRKAVYNSAGASMYAPKASMEAVYRTILDDKHEIVWRPVAFSPGKPSAKCEFTYEFANQAFVLDRYIRSGQHWLKVRARLTFGQFADTKSHEAACHGAIL